MIAVDVRIDKLEQKFFERDGGRRLITPEEARELETGTKTPWDFGVNPNMRLKPGEPLFLVVDLPQGVIV